MEVLWAGILLAVRCFSCSVWLPSSIVARFGGGLLLFVTGLPFLSASQGSLLVNSLAGMICGSIVALFREVGRVLGGSLDSSRGQTLGQILNPLTGSTDSPLSKLLGEMFWVYVVVLGFFPLLVLFHIKSLQLIPLDAQTLSGLGNITNMILSPVMFLALRELSRLLLLYGVFHIAIDIYVFMWNGIGAAKFESTGTLVLRSCAIFVLLYLHCASGGTFRIRDLFDLTLAGVG